MNEEKILSAFIEIHTYTFLPSFFLLLCSHGIRAKHGFSLAAMSCCIYNIRSSANEKCLPVSIEQRDTRTHEVERKKREKKNCSRLMAGITTCNKLFYHSFQEIHFYERYYELRLWKKITLFNVTVRSNNLHTMTMTTIPSDLLCIMRRSRDSQFIFCGAGTQ